MPAGPPRLTQVVLSCLRVPSSLCPNVSSDFFSLPSLSSFPLPAPWFNTGKMVTLLSFLPSAFMDHQLTSCFLLFSLCVCLSYFSSFSPFSFHPPLFCHVTGGCAMRLQTAGLSGCFFSRCLPASPPHLSPPLPSFSLSIEYSTFWKLETKIKERERENLFLFGLFRQSLEPWSL